MTSGGNGPELLEVGPPPASRSTRRRRLALLCGAAVVALVLGVTSQLLPGPDRSSTLPDPSPSATSSSSSPAPSSASTPPTVSTQPTVLRRRGATVPGFGSGDLYARSADAIYRIELGSGWVTATGTTGATGAIVGSSNPAVLLAGPSGVILRPLDPGPGLLVPDGRPARELTGLLRDARQVLPGPGSQLWVSQSFDGRSSIFSLTSFSGRPTGTTVREAGYFLSDAAGGLLLVDTSGVWQRRGTSWRRISDGIVLATGRHHYLLASCDDRHRCGVERYERSTGRRTPARAPERLDLISGGALSPDGRYVAATFPVAGLEVARVLEVDTGRLLAELKPGSAPDTPSQMLWSGDGRHLIGLDDGRLVVLDVATGRLRRPDLGLPDLLGIALRP